MTWQELYEKIMGGAEGLAKKFGWKNPIDEMGAEFPDRERYMEEYRRKQMAPQEQEIPKPKREFDFEAFIEDMEKVGASYPQGIPTPPPDIEELIWEKNPQDATQSAIMALTESNYDPRARNPVGGDTGLMQIHPDTFADYMKRMPGVLGEQGIQNYEQMYDPRYNMDMADIIKQYQGYGAWYGPGNKGFNISRPYRPSR